MQPTVRAIQPADLANVLLLMREFAKFENLSEYCTVTEERLYAAMFGENAVVEGLIALAGQTLVGYAIYYPNFSSFRAQRGMYLEDIYINNKYRGMGLGETIIKEIARTAASRGFERIDFMVLDWNTPAVNFYKKLGAVRDDQERHFKFNDDAFVELAS